MIFVIFLILFCKMFQQKLKTDHGNFLPGPIITQFSLKNLLLTQFMKHREINI
jgi:hypothetical protein